MIYSLLVVIDSLYECRKIILEKVDFIREFVQAIFDEGRFLIWEEYITFQRTVRRRRGCVRNKKIVLVNRKLLVQRKDYVAPKKRSAVNCRQPKLLWRF